MSITSEKADFEREQPKERAKPNRPFEKKKPRAPRKISARYLHNAGLAYLQRFSSSSANFRKIMMRKIERSCRHHTDQDKEECEKLLDDLILKFQDLELLNDELYLRGMVTTYRRRGLSSHQIQQKLMQKGLPSDDILKTITQFEQEEYDSHGQGDLYAAIIFMRKKKFGPFDILQKKDPEKALGSMARAGYSFDIAQKSLKMTMEEIQAEFSFLL